MKSRSVLFREYVEHLLGLADWKEASKGIL